MFREMRRSKQALSREDCLKVLETQKRGTLAVLVYILLGVVGLPVFSGFRGGIGALLGPTGGYLLGFLEGHHLWGGLCILKKNRQRRKMEF